MSRPWPPLRQLRSRPPVGAQRRHADGGYGGSRRTIGEIGARNSGDTILNSESRIDAPSCQARAAIRAEGTRREGACDSARVGSVACPRDPQATRRANCPANSPKGTPRSSGDWPHRCHGKGRTHELSGGRWAELTLSTCRDLVALGETRGSVDNIRNWRGRLYRA